MSEIAQWIDEAGDASQQTFRRVVHIILNAIASQHDLQSEMIMKGGILMAIAYHTGRFTKDIDFSSPKHYAEFAAGQDQFISNLDSAIQSSSATLAYGIACAVQAHQVRPSTEGNYQTLHLNVGYALRSKAGAMAKLATKSAANVVKIDYSFNELVCDLAIIDVNGTEGLQTYGQLTLIAEKLRALIQQAPGEGQRQRGSSRGQDIFDINALLDQSPPSGDAQTHLLQILIDKSESRDVRASKNSMAQEAVYEKSKARYLALADEIEGDLPDFDQAFGRVRAFYEALPWPADRIAT